MFWRRGRRGDDETLATDPDETLLDDAQEPAEDGADLDDLEALDGDAEDAPDDEVDDADAADAGPDGDGDGPIDAEEMSPEAIEAQAREFMADNDTWMYGENAAAVITLLDRLEAIDPYQAEFLLDAWRDLPKGEREVARKAIRRLVETEPEIERQVRLAREAVGNWLAVAADDVNFLAIDAAWPRHAAAVGDTAIDATGALVVKSELDEFDFDVLHRPWVEAIEAWDAEEAARRAAEAEAGSTGDASAAGDADAGASSGAEGPGGDAEFGPNTREVNELLARLWRLPPEQVSRLVSNWEQMPREELQVAHEALKDLVAEDPAYRRQVRRAQEKLQEWLNSGRRDDTAAYLGSTGTADTRRAAGPALADAVAALVLGDLFDRDLAATLYTPWFTLVGAPPLPEPAALEESEDQEDDREEEDDR